MMFIRFAIILLSTLLFSLESFAAISEAEFVESHKNLIKIYGPIVKDLGMNLSINGSWEDDLVNAFAVREEATKKWEIMTSGGLARLPKITSDGYKLILCHELGHFLGGFPKKPFLRTHTWSSVEGQSDYFATLKCTRKLFADNDNETIVKKFQIPEFLNKSCRKTFVNNNEINICIRSAMASLNLVEVLEAEFARIDSVAPNTLSFEILAPAIKNKALDSHHPDNQCRLNTFLQGSLCDKDVNEPLSNESDSNGICSITNGDILGLRPTCWYNPTTSN